MDWHKLYFGEVSHAEVRTAIHDKEWQRLRVSMKGMSTEDKYASLTAYLEMKQRTITNECEMRMVKVRITNYITALSRGGIIKPEDYR